MMTSAQLRAARAMLGIDQKDLAELSGVSIATIQRMESSEGNVRGVVESLTRVVEALNRAGIELLDENQRSERGGRGVRAKVQDVYLMMPDNRLAPGKPKDSVVN